ncbi:DNA helicase [Bacteroidia bacterium]|nr:DNA helicase [Bacteroidia bacterium]
MGSVKVLKASAGSGKTFSLAYKYVSEVVADPQSYRHILAVTFTNKATEEMKHRIVKEIDLLARGAGSAYLPMLVADTHLTPEEIGRRAMTARTAILHDYSRFAVLTIDKFFQRIIRSFLHELGIELSFNLELRTDTLLESAADQMVDDMGSDPALRRWITSFVEERIDNNRRWSISSELASLGGEIFRDGFLSPDIAREELHVIVSEVAAQADHTRQKMRDTAREALEIVAGAGLSPTDFAYGANGFTSWIVALAVGEVKPYGKRVEDALADDAKWYTRTSTLKSLIINLIPYLRPLLEELCRLYDDGVRLINSAEMLRENYRSFALLADLSKKVEELCTRRNILPIAQTNHIIRRLIEGNDAPFIFEKSGSHYSRFLIDEFQDTSLAQWQNFLPLLGNAVAQSDKEPVLLVGDVKQSIYRWRGGDWRILAHDIRRRFNSVEEQALERNYRSLGNIVEFNNGLMATCVEHDNHLLNARLDEAASRGLIGRELCSELTDALPGAYADLHQKARDDAPGGHITVTHYAENEERGGMPPVIERVRQLQRQGYLPGEIALLVRSRKEGRRLVELFMEHKRNAAPDDGVCLDVVTQEALQIGFAPVVGFAVAALKLSVDPADAIARTIFNHYTGDITRRDIDPRQATFLRGVGLLSPLEAFGATTERFALGGDPTEVAYLQAFEQQIINFCLSSVADTALFVEWWQENGASESINLPSESPAITIITIHKAKGLEYRAVIIPFCDWPLNPGKDTVVWIDPASSPCPALGPMPVRYRTAMSESWFAGDYYREMVYSHIDNINILYVALTRAREELHIMMKRRERATSGQTLISALVRAAMPAEATQVEVGELEGVVAEADDDVVASFGTPCTPQRTQQSEGEVGSLSPGFAAASPRAALRLRLQSQRYFEQDAEGEFSPRKMGVLLHRVFQQADNARQIREGVRSLALDGTISRSEMESLDDAIGQALADPLVDGWFSGRWKVVRNESDIIIPGEGSLRRPDRVMIADHECVVVDYKFGSQKLPAHHAQIRQYAELLRRMGYPNVKGYIWYISDGDVARAV